MWSSSAVASVRPLRWAALLAALAGPLMLSACTGLTPVYDTTTRSAVAVQYATPGNRLEQIIYEDLSLRLGAPEPGAPLVTVRTATSTTALTSDIVSTAQRPWQVTVRGNLRITASNGKVLFSGQRVATADYSTNAQVLANSQAANEAAERAAHLLADSLRLTILGTLAP
jgi:hypothetical protein